MKQIAITLLLAGGVGAATPFNATTRVLNVKSGETVAPGAPDVRIYVSEPNDH